MQLGKLGLFAWLFLLVGCGKNVEVQVQDETRTFGNATLDREDVEVLAVRESGQFVVAEVKIRTALKFRREKDGTLVLDEVRTGDRQWQKAEHIQTALDKERTNSTRILLDEVGEALGRFRTATGQLPQAESFEALMDQLSPKYLSRIVRLDGWNNPFWYRPGGGGTFDLRSGGADGRMQTEDDVVLGSR